MIEWVAAVSAEVVNVATPPVRVPVPSVTAPSLNVTVPVAADGKTVAVQVTLWPTWDGFSDEARAVVVSVFAPVTITKLPADAAERDVELVVSVGVKFAVRG